MLATGVARGHVRKVDNSQFAVTKRTIGSAIGGSDRGMFRIATVGCMFWTLLVLIGAETPRNGSEQTRGACAVKTSRIDIDGRSVV